jgi:tetratricopeptide (TPR) repeat protein
MKFRIRLANERIIGPLTPNQIAQLIISKKINSKLEGQLFPDGEWNKVTKIKELNNIFENIKHKYITINELKNLSNLDLVQEVKTLNEHSEIPANELKEFDNKNFNNKEFEKEINESALKEVTNNEQLQFNKELEKTTVRRVVKDSLTENDYEKTIVNADLIKKIKQEKLIEQNKIRESDLPEDKINENEIAEVDPKTELIDINKLKSKLEVVVNENMDVLEKENILKLKNEIKKENFSTKEDDFKLKEINLDIEKKSNYKQKFVRLLIFCFILFFSLDYFFEPNTKNTIKCCRQPVITFPESYEYRNELKSSELYQKGLIEFNKNIYMNDINASNYFMESYAHDSMNNKALSMLLRTYIRFLYLSKSSIRDQNKVYQLLQVAKSKNSKYRLDSNLMIANALFFYNIKKIDVALHYLELHISFSKSLKKKINKDVFPIYMFLLNTSGKFEKSQKIHSKLLKKSKKTITDYEYLTKYNLSNGNYDLIESLLKLGLKKYNNSVKLYLLRAESRLSQSKFSKLEGDLESIKKLIYNQNRYFKSKFLILKGILLLNKGNNKKAIQSFTESKIFFDSDEMEMLILRSKNIDLIKNSDISKVSYAKIKIKKSKKYLLDNKLNKALSYAIEAVDLSENESNQIKLNSFVPASINLSNVYSKQGFYDKAIETLNDSLKISKHNHLEIKLNMIDIYIKTKKYRTANKIIIDLQQGSSLVNLTDDELAIKSSMLKKFKGDIYISKNLLNKAGKQYIESINENPLNDLNFYKLSMIYYKLKKYQKSKKYINNAINLNQSNVSYKIHLSKIMFEREDPELAMGYLRKILEEHKDDPLIKGEIAKLYFRNGQIKLYEAAKKELIESSKPSLSLYLFLMDNSIDGLKYKNMGNKDSYNEAIFNIKEYLLLKPSDLEKRMLLAELYIRQGNIIRESPTSSCDLDEFQNAVCVLKSILDRFNSYPNTRLYLAKCYMNLYKVNKNNKYVENAKLYLQEEIKMTKSYDAYIYLGNMYLEEKNYDDALTQFKTAQKIDDGLDQALMGIGRVAFHTKKLTLALDLFIKVSERNPNNSTSYKYLGKVYKELGQSRLAIESFQKYLELNPTGSDVGKVQNFIKRLQ